MTTTAPQIQTYATRPTFQHQRFDVGELQLDSRRARDMPKLDLDGSLEGFDRWAFLATDYLSAGRQDIRQLLQWAGEQTDVITEEKEDQYVSGTLRYSGGVAQASAAIYTGLVHVTSDSVFNRKGKVAGTGRGLEFWRLVWRERKSKSHHAREARIIKLEQWPKCKDMLELQRTLGIWEHHLGEVVGTDGAVLSDRRRY